MSNEPGPDGLRPGARAAAQETAAFAGMAGMRWALISDDWITCLASLQELGWIRSPDERQQAVYRGEVDNSLLEKITFAIVQDGEW